MGKFRAQAAAFGRLCVETDIIYSGDFLSGQPPSGGCVLKQKPLRCQGQVPRSRLRAAVC